MWAGLMQKGTQKPGRDQESGSILFISSVSCHHSKNLLTHAHSIGPCSWHVTGIIHGISLIGFDDSRDGISGSHYKGSAMQPEPQLHSESQEGSVELQVQKPRHNPVPKTEACNDILRGQCTAV